MNLGLNHHTLPQNGKDVCLRVYEYDRFLQLVNEAQKWKACVTSYSQYAGYPSPKHLTARNTYRFVIYPVLLLFIYRKPPPPRTFLLRINLQDKYRDIWNDLFYLMNFRADGGRTLGMSLAIPFRNSHWPEIWSKVILFI